MTDTQHVKGTLDVLRAYYADRDGQPVQLNAVQIAVYLDGLGRFSEAELEAAARRWMRENRFFPKLSELLAILQPPTEVTAAAHLAWAAVERAIRQGGAYRGAYFTQGAIGETARQVFGTWARACSFDLDSPGWAIRRQSFLAIFPTLFQRNLPPVLLAGLQKNEPPFVVEVDGFPASTALPDGAWTPRAVAMAAVADIRQRALAAGKVRE